MAEVLTDQADPDYGPSGPFDAGINGVPALLYVNPESVPCIPLPFADWMAIHGANPAGTDDDPDFDGFVNAIEYCMVLDPMEWAADEERPELILENEKARYRFRRADYLCPETVVFEVQYSTDLINWTAVPEEANCRG